MQRFHLGAISIAILVVIGYGAINSTQTSAMLTGEDAASSWTNPLTTLSTKIDKEKTIDPEASYWNITCVAVQHKEYNPSQGGLRTVDDCLQTTSYGKVGSSVMLTDSDTGYRLKDPSGALMSNFFAIPRTKDLLFMSGEKLYVYRNFPANFKLIKSLGITQYIQLTNNPWLAENRIHFSSGTAFAGFQPGSFNFSDDGSHMSLNQGRYQVVVDLETLTATTFGTTSIRPWGGTPQMRTSLNYNGRIVFTADSDYDKYFLYDLSSCTGTGIDQPRTCKSRDIRNLLYQQIPGLKFVSTSKFITDDIIELYAVVMVDGQTQTNRYRLSLPGSEFSDFQYIAMGDSYSSGQGAWNYKEETDTSYNSCHVSLDSYPYLISHQLSFSKGESVACSGARIKDIYSPSDKDYNKYHKQMSGKEADIFTDDILSSFLPGYRMQSKFISVYKPSNITLSIAGNDIGFGSIVSKCALPGECYSNDNEKLEIVNQIKGVFPRLVETYQHVIKKSPNSKLYVFGYPYVADPNGVCPLNVPLSSKERKFTENLITDINTMVELAAQKAGVHYVDISNALMGHRLCEASHDETAINGVLLSRDISKNFIARESSHPNALGHELIANAILEKTQNFTQAMPVAKNDTDITHMQSTLLPSTNTNSQTAAHLEDDISLSTLFRGASIFTTINPESYLLNTGSTYTVELHSEPTIIGTATAINPAELKVNASIPSGIAPGIHTVHIYGLDINGKSVDLYKPILVLASENDEDGDGLLNQDDECYFVQPLGIDTDQDNIDDACDNYIGQMPSVIVPSLP